MNESPRRDLEVFDSKVEDDENNPDKNLNRFNKISNLDPFTHVYQSRRNKNNTVLATHQLQVEVKQENVLQDAQINSVDVKNVPSIPCVDVVGSILDLEVGCSNPSFETMEDTFDSKVKNSELGADSQSNSISQENHCHFNINVDYYDRPENSDTTSGASTPETSQIGPSGSPSSKESVDVSSDADDCMNYESAPRSAVSDIAENVSLNGCGLDGALISDASDTDDTNTEVVLRPDYIIYQDNYYTGPMLTFSHSCIKINVSTACMEHEAFDLEWGIDDLIDIKCQSIQSSGTVIIKINVISRNANQVDHASETSGIEELKIAVVDSNWSLIHKQITSLNVKYLAICNIMLHLDVEDDETKSGGSRCYFPNFEEPFDEVIYPKGDADAVSLSKRDFDLLRPDTFVNDTIIDFYIQYLKNQIQEEEKPRFHFFNSFFFRKLADLDKNPSSISDAKAAFQRVRKWTRKVNLFEKDYIFIPVNFNLHWSLIVICHPGEVINNDKELDNALKVPCILHMDSIKGNHSGLKNLLQSYLWEEWKERHKEASEEDFSALFSNLRFLPLALPQQENSYDCGLFLLHYLELFLAEAPLTFNPFKVTKFSNFLNVDWFLPAEAYLKRTLIQRLISELVENHGSREISSSDGSDDHQYIENIENGTGIEHLEFNSASKPSHAGEGIEMTLLSGSSFLDPQSFNNPGMVLKDLFEPGTTAGTTSAQCQSFDQRSSDYRFDNSIFTMEEDTDLGEQFMYLATDTNFQQVAGVTPQACSLPYLPRDCGNGTNHIPEISLQEAVSSPSSASGDTEDIGVTEYCHGDWNEPITSYEAERGEKICSPIENTEHFIDISGSAGNNFPTPSVVGISQDSIMSCDGYKNGDIHSPYQETTTLTWHQVSDAVVDDETACDGQIDISGSAGNNLPTSSVVGIFQEPNCDGYQNGDIHSPCLETPTVTLHQVSDAVDEEAACDDGKMIDGTEPDNSEEQAAKRRRVMPLEGRSEEIVTESNL
ncbi:probable ubiquitin-like-specific protease 2B isoform X4 [Medicago truncatula]|uniref:probable ubiquitin-like-specific protease 2B isoform X4 n=2 Tax=Medicago truncatula TaxID=3880 RepID=UPI000D2F260C|nr:probable ubiquitin-like-specific protease 2B isoform X4 [Medicago truncatula]